MRLLFQWIFIFSICLSLSLTGQTSKIWRRLIDGPRQCYYTADYTAYGQHLLAWIKAWQADFENQIQSAISDSVIIFIAPDKDTFQALTGGRLPEWSAAAAIPDQNVIVVFGMTPWTSQKQARQILHHELCHLILFDWTGGVFLPRWFDEGVAQFWTSGLRVEQSLSLARALRSDQIPALSDLEDLLSLPASKAQIAYGAALDAVSELIQQYGIGVIPRITEHISRGRDFPLAFENATGTSLTAFEGAWRYHLMKRFQWAILLEWPALFSLFIMVLFILAVVTVRKRRRAMFSQWSALDEEETAEKKD